MLVHTRSVADKVFEVWRSPGRFTKNPDIVALPSGRLLIIYSDSDSHWSQENQVLTLLASDDQGRTWFKYGEVAEHDLRRGDERLVTPRLSRLSDGRLVVLVDQDDYGHFHEDQPPGNLAFWSADDGATWSDAQNTGIAGFEPDRMIELPDGALAVGSHQTRCRDGRHGYAEVLTCSDDGGRTWHERGQVAYDGHHYFCEGGMILLDGGRELACLMRDNQNAGYPGWVAFSRDLGRTWSEPQMAPFHLHRPYGKQLADGRVLVTGRNVLGGLGTYAWVGDLTSELGYQVGGPRVGFSADLTDEALAIHNRPDTECRYILLPPESVYSEVRMEAVLNVDGPAGTPVAFLAVSRIGVAVTIAPDAVGIGKGVDRRRPVDMTRYRRVTLTYARGLCRVLIDGETLLNTKVHPVNAPLGGMHRGGPLEGYTHFGQAEGTGGSCWRSVSYESRNRTQPDFRWSWLAADGLWPDEYQRRRLIQVHANEPTPDRGPDHGYSSWVVLDDGRILLVDYTNAGDERGRSHLVGVYIEPEDIA